MHKKEIKIKASAEPMLMIGIGSAIFGLMLLIAAWIFFFQPLLEGPVKAMDEAQYCVAEKIVRGDWDQTLEVKFDSIIDAKALLVYVTPGGFAPLQFHAEEIEVSVNDGTGYYSIGSVKNLEEWDIGKEVSCMGSKVPGWKGKDDCDFRGGYVWKVYAEAVQGTWCDISTDIICGNPYGWFWCSYNILTEGESVSYCNVDKLRVKIYYPCNYESTLMYGDIDPIGTQGVGWNHIYPLEEEVDSPPLSTQCSILNGEYTVRNINKVRQMPFPGMPLTQVGVRAGCAGVQTGCNIQVSFGRPDDSTGCSPPDGGWDLQATFQNLDYEYIYSDPVSVSDYVNTEEESTYYKKWCLRVMSFGGCEINSVDVKRYVK